MITEPVSRYATTSIVSVDPRGTVQDLVDTMARRRIRHVMVAGSRSFLTVDSIFKLIYRLSTVAKDPRHVETMPIGSLKTVEPPSISGFISMAEAARIMASRSLDFLLVDASEGTGLITIRDLIDAVEPGDIRVPAIRYSIPKYPGVSPSSRVIDVISTMGMHGVRSVLLLEGRNAVGVIPSLSVIEALSHLGFHALWDEVASVARPVEAIVPGTATICQAATTMAEHGSEAVVLRIGREIVGVLDEWGIVQAIAGAKEGLMLG